MRLDHKLVFYIFEELRIAFAAVAHKGSVLLSLWDSLKFFLFLQSVTISNWSFFFLSLSRRNKHGVPQEKIARMLDRFSFPISVDIVMNSQEPPHVNKRHK